MNERIKELWEQAAKTTQGDSWEEQTKFMGGEFIGWLGRVMPFHKCKEKNT